MSEDIAKANDDVIILDSPDLEKPETPQIKPTSNGCEHSDQDSSSEKEEEIKLVLPTSPKSPEVNFILLRKKTTSEEVETIQTCSNTHKETISATIVTSVHSQLTEDTVRIRSTLATPRPPISRSIKPVDTTSVPDYIPKNKPINTNNNYKSSIQAVLICMVALYILKFFLFTATSSTLGDSSDVSSSNSADLTKLIEYKNKFNEYMKLIKSKYPNQTNLFWANIESTYRHSILKSKDPSIVLIVSDKLTSSISHDLSYDILNTIKTSIEYTKFNNLNDLIINPSEFNDLIHLKDYDKIKLLIDNKLNKIFSSGQRVALVRSIQNIPATTMLLFYTYGDDLLSAKYPGVVILMTLEVDYDLESEKRDVYVRSSKKIMEFCETYLFKLWSKYVGEDQLKPLFTRIGNNVIFVNTEFN